MYWYMYTKLIQKAYTLILCRPNFFLFVGELHINPGAIESFNFHHYIA